MKKSFAEESFELGGFTVVIGFIILTFFPQYIILGKIMFLASFSSIAFYLKTWSKYNKIFKALELGHDNSYPLLKNKEIKSGYIEYTFTLPHNKSVEDFEKVKEKISQAIGADLEFEYRFKNLIIKEMTEKLKDKYNFEVIKTKGEVEIVIGYTRIGKLITFNLSEGKPHLLVAGETGSGKSTVIRSIITWLILSKDVELYLIDLKKGVEFKIFEKVNKVKAFIKTREEALKLLKVVNAEVEYRYDTFFENDCIDIYEYNAKNKKSALPFQVLIIDEYADLSEDDDCTDLINEIARKSRACGIHLIISTQKPESRVLDTRIKANFSSAIGLRCINATNSQTIIGHKGLEDLKGNGHAIFKSAFDEIELRCPYLEPKRARELIKPFEVNKSRPKQIEPQIITSLDFMEEFSDGNKAR